MEVKTISHIAFAVTDMEKALHFYNEILGFPILCMKNYDYALPNLSKSFCEASEEEKPLINGMISEFEAKKGEPWFLYLKIADGQSLELFYADPLSKKQASEAGYQHLSLETPDIEAVKRQMLQHGYPLDTDIYIGADQTKTMWVSDPDGNKIEFMEYTDDSLQLLFYK